MSKYEGGLIMREDPAVAEIRQQRARLARRLGRGGALMKGSLALRWVRCGRRGCRCASGEKHGPYLYVSVFAGGKTRSVYVPRRLEEEVRRWVANVRAVEADLAAITQLSAAWLRRAAAAEPDRSPGGAASRKSRRSRR
jgi:hypothetical protein